MPVYEYRAINGEGKMVKGLIDAESPRAARAKLKRMGLYPTDFLQDLGQEAKKELARKEINLRWLFARVGAKELTLFTRQLATLLGAGLPLVDALGAMKDEVENLRLKQVIADVREKVNEGSSFADALSHHQGIFSPMYVNMIRAGETSGALEVVLRRLADYTEGQLQIRNRILSSLAYPIFMLGVMALVVSVMVVYVIPKVVRVFEDMGQVLPIYSRMLIGGAYFVRDWWWLLLGILGGLIYGTRQYLRSPIGRERFDRWILRLPLIGKLIKMTAISRFSRTLSVLLSSGVPLLQALDIVKNIFNNRVLERAIEGVREEVAEGSSIAEPLRRTNLFPPMVVQMVSTGEQSGELEEMLLKISEAYDAETEAKVAGLTSLLGPVVIMIMGGLVFFIMISILIPIFQMNQLIH